VNILFLALYPPLPAIDGGRLRTYNTLRQAARHQPVTLLAFDDPLCTPEQRAALQALCEVITVPLAPAPPRTPLQQLAGVAAREPIGLRHWQSAAMHARLRDLAAERRHDLVHVDHLALMPYAADLPGLPVVLTHHNVEALAQQRQHGISRAGRLRRWLDTRESERWRRYEIAASRRADALVVVSDIDAGYFRAATPGTPLFVAPNGVDTGYFTPRGPASGARLLYTGAMNYAPNVDAVCWFCADIFPAIRRARPDAEFVIAGRDPTPEVRALAAIDGVCVTGRVDDMRAYYAQAAMLVVPLRSGGGTRLEILEAMAMGMPVISTSIGCEGLNVQNGIDIVIADTPGDFATQAAALIANVDHRHEIGTAARHTVVAGYDWDAVYQQQESAYTTARKSQQ